MDGWTDLEGKKLLQNLFLIYFCYLVSCFGYGQGMSCSHVSVNLADDQTYL